MTTTSLPKACEGCGEQGAKRAVLILCGDDVIVAHLCGTACRQAIYTRDLEWYFGEQLAKPVAAEGACVDCSGSFEYIHEKTGHPERFTTRGLGVDVYNRPLTFCLPCAVKIEMRCGEGTLQLYRGE